MEDKTIDTILEETKFTLLTINGKEFKIGKIKGFYYLKLVTLISKIGKKYHEQFASFKGAPTDMGDILALLQILNCDDGMELLSILLGIEDIEFCKSVNGEDIPDIVIAVCKYNDFDMFKKKVLEMVEVVTNKMSKKTS